MSDTHASQPDGASPKPTEQDVKANGDASDGVNHAPTDAAAADPTPPAESTEPNSSSDAPSADAIESEPPASDSPPGAPDDQPNSEPAPPEPSLEDQLAAAEQQVTLVRDKMLRVAADFENFRKRAARNVTSAGRQGVGSAVKQLLPVFDNLERAISAPGDEHGSGMASGLITGLRMVLKQLDDGLGKLGVRRVAAVGKPFDPALHEGIQHAFSAEHEAGTVMAELQPGYVMGSELLRPTLAIVSRGAEPTTTEGTDDGAGKPADEDPGASTDDSAQAAEPSAEPPSSRPDDGRADSTDDKTTAPQAASGDDSAN